VTLLRFLFQKARPTALLAVACGIASGAANALFIRLVGGRVAGGASASTLVVCILALVVGVAANTGSQRLLNWLSEEALYALRLELGKELLGVPLRKLESLGKHRVLAALTEDVAQIAAGLTNLPSILIYGSTLLVCFGFLLWLSPAAFALWLFVLVIGSAVYHALNRRAVRAFEAGRKHEDELFRAFTALADGARELRSNRARRYDFVHGELARAARGHRDELRRGLNLFTTARATGDTAYLVFLLAFAWAVGDRLVLSNETRSLLVLLMLYSMTPLVILVNLVPILSRAEVAASSVKALGLSLAGSGSSAESSVQHSLDERLSARPFERFETLELRAVAFRYPATREREGFAIGPLDLELQNGEVVFLCGGNGGGKTTLAKVLSGLYVPDAGRILLDGRAIELAELDLYRQLFSAVWFDFHLFEALPDAGVPNEIARLRLERLRLGDKVSLTDRRFSTTELSQGQRKRLALLSAWLEDRPLFVFDEWAADQDPEFRRFFYEELLLELKSAGKTVFAITHDEHYFHVADRLLHLENGTLTELREKRAKAAPRTLVRSQLAQEKAQ
jgi:putative ATP-binding cassette transporter